MVQLLHLLVAGLHYWDLEEMGICDLVSLQCCQGL